MARVTMLAMHRDGLIVLPPPKWKRSRPRPIVFGQDTEPPLFPPPTTLDEVRPLGDPHRRRRDPAGQAVERVRRPPPLPRLQDPRRRPDALRRPRPQRLAARHARLQHRRVDARPARPLHRMDSRSCAGRTCRSSIDNPRFLILPWIRIPNLGSHILATRPPPPAPRLDPPLQHHPRPHRDLRRDPPLHRRRLQGLRLDPRRHHHRDAGATTPPSSTASPPRMSGSAPSPNTGNASSTAEPHPPHDPHNRSLATA